jgi:hypothetical protein
VFEAREQLGEIEGFACGRQSCGVGLVEGPGISGEQCGADGRRGGALPERVLGAGAVIERPLGGNYVTVARSENGSEQEVGSETSGARVVATVWVWRELAGLARFWIAVASVGRRWAGQV